MEAVVEEEVEAETEFEEEAEAVFVRRRLSSTALNTSPKGDFLSVLARPGRSDKPRMRKSGSPTGGSIAPNIKKKEAMDLVEIG